MTSAQKFYGLNTLLLLGIVLLPVLWYASKPVERPTLPRPHRDPTPYIIEVTNYTKYSAPMHLTLWTNNVQLCIMFNLYNMAPNEAVINLLLSYYTRFFNHIMVLFDGKWKKPNYLPENVTFSGCDGGAGWFEHECLRICLNETWLDSRPEGYLFVADDMFINIAMMNSLPLSQIWYLDTPDINYTARASLANTWHWNEALNPLEVIVEHLPAEWMDRLVKNVGFPGRIHAKGAADIVYVPISLAENMTDVLTYITKTAALISEVGLPLAVDIVAPTDQVHITNGYLWREQRTMDMIKKTAKKAHFVHPIKLGRRPEADLWKSLMDEQLKNLSLTSS